jgi:hypothetical protein
MKIVPKKRLVLDRTYPAGTPPSKQPRIVGGILKVPDTGDEFFVGADAELQVTRDGHGDLVFKVTATSI